MTKTKQNSTTFINYEGTGEKLKELKENSLSSRGRKMNTTEYLNFLISYAHKNKIYFKEIVTDKLKYEAVKK